MYKIRVNDQYAFDLEASGEGIKLNAEIIEPDIRDLGNGHMHVLHGHRSYTIEILNDSTEKPARIKVNGRMYEVAIEDEYAGLLKALGMNGVSGKKTLELKAPMPGLVLSINVTAGQEVKKGDSLLILEAMKMENMLKSTTDGVVKKIYVTIGDKVEKGQVLIEFVA
jgi:biotin carboxyl carrier protein